MPIASNTATPVRIGVLAIALSLAFASVNAFSEPASVATVSSKRMANGKQWTTHNLHVNIVPSYCYKNAEPNCNKFGRLYP